MPTTTVFEMGSDGARQFVIYGAGDHAKVCLEVIREDPDAGLVAALSDSADRVSGLGLEVVDAQHFLSKLTESGATTTFCVAVGNGRIRQEISMNLTESGHSVTTLVSRSAVVSPSAVLGAGSQILPGAVVMAAARLGDGVIVNTNASVDHDCSVGAFAHIAPGSVLAGGVTVGERTLVGVGATVLPYVTVGSDAIVGGGSVVIADVPDGVTVVGNPARIIGPTPERTRR